MTRVPATVRHRALLAFVLLNYLAAGVHAQRYVRVAEAAPGWPGAIFAHLALLAQVGLVALGIHLLLWLVSLADPFLVATRLGGALLFTLLNAFIYVDSRIFALFRFHFNGLALNVLLTPGGWESMQLPAGDVAVAGAGVGLLFLLELVAYTLLLRPTRLVTLLAPRPARRSLALVGVVLGLVVTERLAYVAGETFTIRDITRQAGLIPFYEPLRVRRALDRRAAALPGLPDAARPPDPGSLLSYPRAPLLGRVQRDRRWNVVWIVVESWRFDVFTPDNTPHIWAFSRKGQVFQRHLSGGNSTRFGIFSMLYGLYGTYWWPFLTENREPLLLAKLAEAGYRFRVVSSTSLRYPEFRRTAFATLQPSITDRLPGGDPTERDASLARTFEEFVAATSAGDRFFAFLFLDSPHFPFVFPPGYGKYLPVDADPSVSRLDSAEDVRRLFNRYRNSVLYADAVVARLLGTLERTGLLDRTIVVVTGDHGQEFREHGFLGHGSAFTPEQTRVPLVLYVPGLPFREYSHLTQHHDLPATMLPLLGVDDPPAQYGLGRNMLEAADRPYAVVCGYRDCAIQDADGWLVFGIEGKTALQVDARDPDYREVADRAAAVRRRTRQLTDVMREMRLFLR